MLRSRRTAVCFALLLVCAACCGRAALSSDLPDLYSPQTSPDGLRTLWESLERGGSIWMTEREGAEPVFVTRGDSPSWVDDEVFNFVVSEDDGHDVYQVDLWQRDLRSGTSKVIAYNMDNPDYQVVVASDRLSLSGKTICIDPGHGKDTGAWCSFNSRSEDYYNLLCADALKGYLQGAGAKIVMTRTDNSNCPSLRSRVNFSNAKGAKLFVSIHYNSSDDGSVRGIEVYHRSGNDTGKGQAKYICDEMGAASYIPVRGVRADKPTLGYYLGVLGGHNIGRCCLTEGGYLSNATDARLIERSDFAGKMAKAIMKGIQKTLGVKTEGDGVSVD